MTFRPGDQVVVTDGPYVEMTGTILVPKHFDPTDVFVDLPNLERAKCTHEEGHNDPFDG
jgi:hypothetical protein